MYSCASTWGCSTRFHFLEVIYATDERLILNLTSPSICTQILLLQHLYLDLGLGENNCADLCVLQIGEHHGIDTYTGMGMGYACVAHSFSFHTATCLQLSMHVTIISFLRFHFIALLGNMYLVPTYFVAYLALCLCSIRT